jgi:hypothetical protein
MYYSASTKIRAEARSPTRTEIEHDIKAWQYSWGHVLKARNLSLVQPNHMWTKRVSCLRDTTSLGKSGKPYQLPRESCGGDAGP